MKVFKAALLPERADTPRVAEGRRELTYNQGLRKLQTGIKQALRPGGESGVAKAKSALRDLRNAARRAGRAARKIG